MNGLEIKAAVGEKVSRSASPSFLPQPHSQPHPARKSQRRALICVRHKRDYFCELYSVCGYGQDKLFLRHFHFDITWALAPEWFTRQMALFMLCSRNGRDALWGTLVLSVGLFSANGAASARPADSGHPKRAALGAGMLCVVPQPALHSCSCPVIAVRPWPPCAPSHLAWVVPLYSFHCDSGTLGHAFQVNGIGRSHSCGWIGTTGPAPSPRGLDTVGPCRVRSELVLCGSLNVWLLISWSDRSL